jgi:urate oxidase
MSARLQSNHYGKHMVRLLRVQRNDDVHDVAEWEADIVLEGELSGSYLGADNSSIVPTDTIKNTVLALAHDRSEVTRDEFALLLAEHFLSRYPHLSAVDAEVRERLWTRMALDGTPHPHAFVRDGNGQPYSTVRQERAQPVCSAAGIRGFVILKTTASGFSGYPQCEFTTLPETSDRILSTSLDARWDYGGGTADLQAGVLDVMLKVFAETFSPSVQRTMFQMGEAALAAFSGIERIHLTMPNRHYLSLDLSQLKRPADQKTIFIPTDDPFGFIEAVVAR